MTRAAKVIFEAEFTADVPANAKRWVTAKRMHDAGITYKAIGKALGVSATRARGLHFRGERHLRRWAEYGLPDFWGQGIHPVLPTLDNEAERLAAHKPARVLSVVSRMARGEKARDWLHV